MYGDLNSITAESLKILDVLAYLLFLNRARKNTLVD
jgi:hypothetical protein